MLKNKSVLCGIKNFPSYKTKDCPKVHYFKFELFHGETSVQEIKDYLFKESNSGVEKGDIKIYLDGKPCADTDKINVADSEYYAITLPEGSAFKSILLAVEKKNPSNSPERMFHHREQHVGAPQISEQNEENTPTTPRATK